ncbi:serine protease [Crassisporium funariophilum]|nr:serine protease [Crassisporium funariophilum]
MRFFTVTFATLAILAAPVFAAPSSMLAVETYSGSTSGKYIVKLKAGVSKKAWIKKLGLAKTVDWDIVNGFASTLDTDALNTLRASADVELISEDGIMHTMAVQENAPWGLERISSLTKPANQDAGALTYTYTYDDTAGEGVDIYIVDTGVYVDHTQFGGRARWGLSVEGYAEADGHGHGTHCAGTAAGSQYGVAKNANIIAVKVLSDAGSGSISGIVTGLNWVISQAKLSGRPTIVSMSLGGGASTVLDNAIASLTEAGIHVAVAAGNSNTDAANTSPARSPTAITVGASTIADTRASFSNYGAVVDIFAPGLNVFSSWIGSNTATNIISGTSMATPHIAGLIAYLVGKDGNVTPAEMATKLKGLSVKGVLTGIPSTTVNELAQNA